MTAELLTGSLTISSSAALGVAFALLVRSDVPGHLMRAHSSRWAAYCRRHHAASAWRLVPRAQWAGTALLVTIALVSNSPAPLLIVPPLLALPAWSVRRAADRRRERLGEQLDQALGALGNALTTSPSLGDALRSCLEHVESPFRDELAGALEEVDLGRPLPEALDGMARRLAVPGLETAVSALLLGQRTGGDLPQILARIAATLREMSRLEGVIRTRTAEGRSQAWVMGGIPPLLVLALERLDPEWLAPLWSDPLGWAVLGGCAVLEVTAVALIRKIMAVEI